MRKILFITPEFEEQGRGITSIVHSMIKAAKANGYEVGILAGYPKTPWKNIDKVNQKMENQYIQHYLADGKNTVKEFYRGGLKRNLPKVLFSGQFFTSREYKVDTTLVNHPSEVMQSLDYIIKIPFVYQFWIHGVKLMKPLLKRACKKYGVDIVISGAPLELKNTDLGGQAKFGQFVHDVMPLEMLETPIDRETPIRFAKQFDYACNHSDFILVNSEDTKRKVDQINPNAQVSVLLGVASDHDDNLEESDILERYKLQKNRYLLFISALEKRKNISRLLQAYAKIYDQIKIPLVLIGGKGYKFDEIERTYKNLPKLIQKNVIFTWYISSEDKNTLLKHARAFVWPTIYEGLGLPVIEALQYGLPVLTSRAGALTEVGGNAAIYVKDPYDLEEIAQNLVRITQDQKLRQKLVNQAAQQTNKFTQAKFNQRFKDALAQVK